jgi:branched-subunit amino acid transport protein
MSIFWMSLIGTSIVVFILRYTGHLIPEKYLTNPRMLKINTLIPVALLSALVAVQTFTKDSALAIDQRMAGLGVAIVALMLKAPFPVVVLGAAVTSAALFHLN